MATVFEVSSLASPRIFSVSIIRISSSAIGYDWDVRTEAERKQGWRLQHQHRGKVGFFCGSSNERSNNNSSTAKAELQPNPQQVLQST
eukprot:m.68741 g.68741  ORF g.68741 m.68741 type:complete len:88 (+) comp23986_c1_seq3:93-356(+)